MLSALTNLISKKCQRRDNSPWKKVEPKSEGEGNKIVKSFMEVPRAERVGIALFGLQGMSGKLPSMEVIMKALIPYVSIMPAPNGKVVGMALQGFKEVSGIPSGSTAEVLEMISHKMSAGWSSRRVNGKRTPQSKRPASSTDHNLSRELKELLSDAQVTVRSALSGTRRMERSHPTVRRIMKSIAMEILSWNELIGSTTTSDATTTHCVLPAVDTHTEGDRERPTARGNKRKPVGGNASTLLTHLDRRTIKSILECFRGSDIETEPEVTLLLKLLNIQEAVPSSKANSSSKNMLVNNV